MTSATSLFLLLPTPSLLPSFFLTLMRLLLSLLIGVPGMPRIGFKMSSVGLKRGALDDITKHATIVKINPLF